ncbi:hypothetical protein BDB00DRAFT_787860 [Zychaea mexicana]|uniref:uncharacterized protein n=1 Tax=Zychaea mexicana TaxID=64656 RepID=UPI0022FF0460|nr:uncharacterized protein BDB00DRAFT_787860 [Zychaea mexicana]KAI9493557.1 hypothetical protein BDB00DRAFT_787860 [Zychaea mexicana]
MPEAAFADVKKKYDDVINAGKTLCPIHSMIIDPDDPIYPGKLSEEDLDEIRDHKAVAFDEPLPSKLHDYLYHYKGATTLSDLNQKIMSRMFHPTDEPDLFRAWETFLQVANIYNYKALNDDFIEDDIEYRVWFFVSKCFASTKVRASSLTNYLIMFYNNNDHEIAFSEVGLCDDGENGTKELYERGLKASKMLKDFFVSLTNTFPNSIRTSRTAAFIISAIQNI